MGDVARAAMIYQTWPGYAQTVGAPPAPAAAPLPGTAPAPAAPAAPQALPAAAVLGQLVPRVAPAPMAAPMPAPAPAPAAPAPAAWPAAAPAPAPSLHAMVAPPVAAAPPASAPGAPQGGGILWTDADIATLNKGMATGTIKGDVAGPPGGGSAEGPGRRQVSSAGVIHGHTHRTAPPSPRRGARRERSTGRAAQWPFFQ